MHFQIGVPGQYDTTITPNLALCRDDRDIVGDRHHLEREVEAPPVGRRSHPPRSKHRQLSHFEFHQPVYQVRWVLDLTARVR